MLFKPSLKSEINRNSADLIRMPLRSPCFDEISAVINDLAQADPTCPRHGAQTAHVADFHAWRHDTNYLHDDGVNNMHDHNESATDVSP